MSWRFQIEESEFEILHVVGIYYILKNNSISTFLYRRFTLLARLQLLIAKQEQTKL